MSDKDLLTERKFWEDYWNNKRGQLITPVPEDGFHQRVLNAVVSANPQIKSAIELGGFPGTFSIYIKKKFNIDTTLLDYFIDQSIVDDLLQANGLEKDAIHLIEDDLTLDHPVSTKYDFVFSVGLIEHFVDTKGIIKRHLDYINPNGDLLIILPNFRGVNGWLQRKFDKANYDVHNINSMDLDLLKSIAAELKIKDVSVHYTGKFSIWLENYKTKSVFVKVFYKALFVFGKVFTRIVPVESKALSPLIVLKGKVS